MWNSRVVKPSTAVSLSTCPSFLSRTMSPLEMEERAYLIDRSHNLMNDLGELELQKQYYRNKLHTELRSNHQELQQCLKNLNTKSHMIINLQEQLERERKQMRLMADDYISLKNMSENDKQLFQREMENKDRICKEMLQEQEHKLRNEHEIATNKLKLKMTTQFDEAIALKNKMIDDLSKASEGIIAEFKKLQDQHKLLLVKIDNMVQDQLHKQLRKRDREERDRYNQDCAYRQALKKDNEAMRQQVINKQKQIEEMRSQIEQLKAENDINRKKLEEYSRQISKLSKKQEKSPKISQHSEQLEHEYDEAQINTDQQYVPIAVPSSDMNMLLLIQSLRRFLGQAIIQVLGEIYAKSPSNNVKGNASSLNSFRLSMEHIKEARREIALVLYAHSKLQEILRLYYPGSLGQTETITIKENFIRNCLEECAGMRNKPVQQLFRLLELNSRIRNPLNHTNTMANLSEEVKALVQSHIIKSGSRMLMA